MLDRSLTELSRTPKSLVVFDNLYRTNVPSTGSSQICQDFMCKFAERGIGLFVAHDFGDVWGHNLEVHSDNFYQISGFFDPKDSVLKILSELFVHDEQFSLDDERPKRFVAMCRVNQKFFVSVKLVCVCFLFGVFLEFKVFHKTIRSHYEEFHLMMSCLFAWAMKNEIHRPEKVFRHDERLRPLRVVCGEMWTSLYARSQYKQIKRWRVTAIGWIKGSERLAKIEKSFSF